MLDEYKTFDFEAFFKQALEENQPLSLPFEKSFSIDIPNHDLRFDEEPDIKIYREAFDKETEHLRSVIGPEKIDRFEHVGSTSIPGMPGMKSIDIFMLMNNFPPTNEDVLKLGEAGYLFKGFYKGTPHDTFFVKIAKNVIHDDNDPTSYAGLHIIHKDDKLINWFINFRNLATRDPEVFNEYKQIKLQSIQEKKTGSFMDYKTAKNSSLVSQILNKYSHLLNLPPDEFEKLTKNN